MAHHEQLFPTDVSFGSRGGPGFSTSAVETTGGEDYRLPRWSREKRRFDASYGIKTHAQAFNVYKFYLRRHGIANSFNYEDPFDNATSENGTIHVDLGGAAVTHNDQPVGTGDGNQTQWQLNVTYDETDDPDEHVRPIEKLAFNTTLIGIDGVNQASGWSVDITTGMLTFTTAPTAGQVITWGGQYYVPVLFGTEVDEALEAIIEQFDIESIPSIPLVEANGSVVHYERMPPGGGKVTAVNGDTFYSFDMGACVPLILDQTGRNFILPSKTNLNEGDQHITIKNVSTSAFDCNILTEQGGTPLATLAQNEYCDVYMYDDSGTKKYLLTGDV